jgi:pimeloyl-ACP methyl ester carboxylesterase
MDVKETKISAGQTSLNVFSVGDPNSKPIVLIHGLRDSARSLTHIASKLAHKYYVLLPELRGHGGSQRFHSYNMPDFLGDLYHIVDRFTDGTCALLGHSLGGHIASKYAALFPEQIKSLILVEGLGPPNQKNLCDSDELQTYRSTLISRSIKANTVSKPMLNLEEAINRLRLNNSRLGEAKAKEIAEFLTTSSKGALTWNFDPKANGVFIGTSYAENEKFWRQITCPSCIVSGALSYEYWGKDSSTNNRPARFQEGEMEGRVANFRETEHHWFDKSGHMVHYDEPDRLADLCNNFLEKKYE